MNKQLIGYFLVFGYCLSGTATAGAATPEQLIATIKEVGREGRGNRQAAQAIRELTQADAHVLPVILSGFHNAGPLAANWLRSAFETIADRQTKSGGELPTTKLESFVLDRSQNPRARRLAFEWLVKVDPAAGNRLIPGMIDDPSSEMRRDAVARLITEAESLNMAKKTKKATAIFQKALKGAIDDDQVKAIVGPLKKLGHPVDIQRHFGFLTGWQIIGPFDNRKRVGFDAEYPPEMTIDLKKKHKGQLGEVAWQSLSTTDDYGIVDIAKQVKPYKEAVMYLACEFNSDKRRDVELRLGTPNAWKVWVNGKLLFSRLEYHRGMALDQYRVKAVMNPGKNIVLLKMCQNEQTQSWAQRYQFQLRICDATGAAVLSQKKSGEPTAGLSTTKRAKGKEGAAL